MDAVELRERLSASLRLHVPQAEAAPEAAETDAPALQNAGSGFFARGAGAPRYAEYRCFACERSVAVGAVGGELLTVSEGSKQWFALCAACHGSARP